MPLQGRRGCSFQMPHVIQYIKLTSRFGLYTDVNGSTCLCTAIIFKMSHIYILVRNQHKFQVNKSPNLRACLILNTNAMIVRPVHMGSQVPHPTRVSKSQHGDEVPTFGPQRNPLKYISHSLNDRSLYYFMQKNFHDFESWVWLFCSTQLNTKSKTSPPKSVAM